MIIYVGIFFSLFGLLLFKFYRGYRFDHTIGIPIIVLGILISLGGIGYVITEKNTPRIIDLKSSEIDIISVDFVYYPKDSLKENCSYEIDNPKEIKLFLEKVRKGRKVESNDYSTTWYVYFDVKLKTGKTLLATFTKADNYYLFEQDIKFILRATSGECYRIENLMLLFENIK